MVVEVNIKDLLICLVLIALVVLLIYLIVLVKHAITAVKNINTITADAKVVSKIAADRSSEVNGLLDNLGASLGGLKTAAKGGNENLISALSSVFKATQATVKYFRDQKNKAEK